jgi:DNA adenine methylase
MMPRHTHYVEPFFGGGAVLLAKDPNGVSEVANDLDGDLTEFWEVLRSPKKFEKLVRRLEATPFSMDVYKKAKNNTSTNSVVRAASSFVVARQSLAGRGDSFAPLSRNRVRRGMNEQCSAWLTAIEGLPAVHQRLKRVAILNDDAVKVIPQQDGPNTLFYVDPPYLPETRRSPDVYRFEMSYEEHEQLLEVLRNCTGKVMLSGYRSDLYDRTLEDWHRVDFDVPNNAAGGKKKRRMTESVWCNFQPKRT